MRTLLKLGLMSLLVALPSATLAVGGGPAAAKAAGPGQVITIPGDRFVPFALTVNVGDTVTWQNQDSDPHAVVTVPGAAPAPIDLALPPGGSASFTFTTPGAYWYYCDEHARVDPETGQVASLPAVDAPSEPMEGVILVQGAVPDAAPQAAVTIPGDSVSPFLSTVTAGGSVTWTNADSDAHTVVAVPGSSPAPLELTLAPGASQTVDLSVPGLYWYYCSAHARWDEANGQVAALESADAPTEPMMGVVAVLQAPPLAGGSGGSNDSGQATAPVSVTAQRGGRSFRWWLPGLVGGGGGVTLILVAGLVGAQLSATRRAQEGSGR